MNIEIPLQYAIGKSGRNLMCYYNVIRLNALSKSLNIQKYLSAKNAVASMSV